MSQALQQRLDPSDIERVLVGGDLSRLSPEQRVQYVQKVCASLGLNPLTRPFQYLKLSGKEVLYATRDCTEQLRKLHKVAITIVARERHEDIYVVTARATTPDGRTDESIGAVPIAGVKGESLANAFMKAETKAKRRVTLSVCGLGLLDESEVESIPDAQRAAIAPVAPMRALAPATPHDPTTGEVLEPKPAPTAAEQLLKAMLEAKTIQELRQAGNRALASKPTAEWHKRYAEAHKKRSAELQAPAVEPTPTPAPVAVEAKPADDESTALRHGFLTRLDACLSVTGVQRITEQARERQEAGHLSEDDLRTVFDAAKAVGERMSRESHDRHHGAGREAQ